MPSRRTYTWILAALLFASALPIASQPLPAGRPLGPLTVVFSVTDKKGQPVADLKTTDIKLREDGKDQPVASVRNVTATPVSIVMLVDLGASTATLPTYWQAEAGSFFTSALRKGVDKGAVFHFRMNTTKTQDFTDDTASLSTAVKQTGGTGASALYNALASVADSLGSTTGRRALVLMADGDNTGGGGVTLDTAAQMLRENGIVVFPVVVKSDRILPPDAKGEFFVKRLAEETGGVVFNTTNVKEAREVFKTIQELLASQFELQYQPGTGGDGKFHKLRIDVADKNRKVRQPSGYYAKP